MAAEAGRPATVYGGSDAGTGRPAGGLAQWGALGGRGLRLEVLAVWVSARHL
jgi:hypothetical protein